MFVNKINGVLIKLIQFNLKYLCFRWIHLWSVRTIFGKTCCPNQQLSTQTVLTVSINVPVVSVYRSWRQPITNRWRLTWTRQSGTKLSRVRPSLLRLSPQINTWLTWVRDDAARPVVSVKRQTAQNRVSRHFKYKLIKKQNVNILNTLMNN